MDKYEYKVKLEQIEKMAAKKDFVTAAKIADGIDWRKVKSVSTLSMIADIYEETNQLEECYELLNMVYDRSPIGRRIVYHMAEVAVKMHDFGEAIDLYKEFVKIAPNDLNRYILKYRIYRERGSLVTDQIAVLEEFKSHEYDEKWAYELACLYEEAGMIDQCIEECDELILWFSEGEYVVKAMELKMKYQKLTASQQVKYEHRFDYLEDEEVISEEEQSSIYEKEPEPVEFNTEELQDIAKETVKAESEEKEGEEAAEEDTPQVSEINLNKFSTINLQKELAMNLQEVLALSEKTEEEEEPEVTEEPEEEQPVQGDTQEFIPFKTVAVEEAETEPEEAAEPIKETAEPIKETAEPIEETEKIAEVKETPVGKTGELTETAELKTEILKYVSAPPKSGLEEFLRTEEDGQMTLVMNEGSDPEKQITGQMTIGEILEAWEEKKRQIKEQLEISGEKKPAVLYETGEITGLLEDFIPKTPKETDTAERISEAAEETAEPIEEAELIEETAEPIAEIAELTEETVEPAEEAEPEFEDDLPQDIDLEEALESLMEEEPKEEEKPKIGENTASIIAAIDHALALEAEALESPGKHLTEEQEKIFAYFTSVNGMKNQLITLLNEDSEYEGKEDSREGNLIITGYPGNGKTTLAIDIVRAIQKQRKVKGAKLAKVSGDGFNKKNPEEVIAKLGGGALIIERAGNLKDETVELLSDAMERFTGGLLVILEDDTEEIEKLMKKHERFAVKFSRSVDIPIFSNDELVTFGKSYAAEKEYFFDDMAVLALYDSIGVRQTSEHVVNITEVKDFIDNAIAHAERKNKGFWTKLTKKRIDEYGNKLLLEEDFNF